jgi:hypothetical protein
MHTQFRKINYFAKKKICFTIEKKSVYWIASTNSSKGVLVLANKRRFSRDKPLEEFQGHTPTEEFAI